MPQLSVFGVQVKGASQCPWQNEFSYVKVIYEGWYQMDAERLVGAAAGNFIFDDPAEPEPVNREMLPGYMQRWDRRTRALDSLH